MQYSRVEITSVNTSQLKVLTEAQTGELLRKTQAGDKKAREALIVGNLRLVLSVVQRFSSRNENPDDLFQVGCMGLIKAVDHFDLSQGVRFSTYAVPMIIGEIRRFLRDRSEERRVGKECQTSWQGTHGGRNRRAARYGTGKGDHSFGSRSGPDLDL